MRARSHCRRQLVISTLYALDALRFGGCSFVALNGVRRVVFDRRWNEKRVLGVIGQNPLDYTSSQGVMEWAKWHPAAHVDSFAGGRVTTV